MAFVKAWYLNDRREKWTPFSTENHAKRKRKSKEKHANKSYKCEKENRVNSETNRIAVLITVSITFRD